MTIWHTSDLHFNHPYVAKLRGYTKQPAGVTLGDTTAHDDMIISRWNSVVKDTDRVYIAGDFAVDWHGVEKQLAALKGEKILVTGNHDIMAGNHRDGWKHVGEWIGENRFAGITAYARRKIGTREILISHYPYTGDHSDRDRHIQFRLRDEGRWLFHGHIHDKDTRVGLTSGIYWGIPPGLPIIRGRQIHVGVDAWDFTPVAEQTLLKLMDSADAEYGWDGKKFPWEKTPGTRFEPLTRGET